MTTGLPSTNNFWLLSLIGGVVLVLFGVGIIDHTPSLYIDYLNEVKSDLKNAEIKLEQSESLLEMRKDTINYIFNKNNVSKNDLIFLEKIVQKDSVRLEKAKRYREDRKEAKLQRELEFEIKKSKRNLNNLLGYISIIIGLILFSTGYYKIYKFQIYRDRILYNDYLNLDVRFENCQSCGMNLVDDKNFDKKSNYCSFCFQDNEFTLKNISFDEFKILVEEQLKKKKIPSNNRKSFLRKLNQLDRWKTKFNWDNFEESTRKS